MMAAPGLVIDFGADRITWDGSEKKVYIPRNHSLPLVPIADRSSSISDENEEELTGDDEILSGEATAVKTLDFFLNTLIRLYSAVT
ncbi:hypothetical protein ON010_g11871 [Phytophthora cinnamomi]|nr:hypothetical protein ON010_g11871 [Phytophthora cinnamomi]